MAKAISPSANAWGYSTAGSEPASIANRTECVLLYISASFIDVGIKYVPYLNKCEIIQGQ